jgi:S-adenosylmethionine/arginine decarboxylase-like enzyme
VNTSYGPHLMGDLNGTYRAGASDGPAIYEFLLDLCEEIGMDKIGSPHLDWYSGEHEAWTGFSATIHIQTSHITLHAFTLGYLFIDIFSCKPFSHEKAIEFVERFWCPTDADWCSQLRGLNFPAEFIDPEQRATFGGTSD